MLRLWRVDIAAGDEMKPIKITAHLKCGFSATFDWAISIDSLIASQQCMQLLGFEQYVENQSTGNTQTHDNLPIEKEYFNGDWWYQVSRPFFDCKLVHTKYLHRRFNIQEAESHVSKIGKIETTKGAYKNARLAKSIFITPSVAWFVNGDIEIIQTLLSDVTHIGANRGCGHGAVSRWEFSEHDNLDDCRFKRIVPVDYAAQHNIDGITIEWGIRPDYRLPENQFLCVIPENEVGNVKTTCIA